MDLIEFIVPSGHKVYFKPYLTYGEKRALRRVLASSIDNDIVTGKQDSNVSGDKVIEAQELAAKFMIKRIITAGGVVKEGELAYQEVMNWESEADGDAVFHKMNEITSSKAIDEESKKK
jgi:hypothetical protein